MPPVQVPEIKRDAPVDTPSVGRMDVNVPDAEKAIAPQAAATDKLGNETGKYIQREEDFAVNSAKNQAAYDYHGFLDGELKKAQQDGSDPDEAYDKYYNNVMDYRENFFSDGKYANMPDRYKDAINLKLDDVDNKFQAKQITTESAQRMNYDTNLTNGTVGISKDGMMSDSELIQKGHQDTLVPIQKRIDDITDARYKNGEKYGTVTRDENGGYNPNPSVDLQTRKDISDSLTSTVQNLYAAHKTDEAQMVIDRFGDQILDKKKLMVGGEKAVITKNAYGISQQVQDLPPDQMYDKIQSLTDDPQTQEKALALANSHAKQMDFQKTRQNNLNFNDSQSYLSEVMKGAKPYQSTADVDNDPFLAARWDKMSSKQQEALYSMVVAPKISNQGTKTKMFDMVKDGSLFDLSPADRVQAEAGLSSVDRKMFDSIAMKGEGPDAAINRSRMKSMTPLMTQALESTGYITRNRNTGRFEGDDETNKNNALAQMLQTEMPHNMSPKDQETWIKKFAADKAIGKAFTAPARTDGGGTVLQTKPAPAAPQATQEVASSTVPGVNSGNTLMAVKKAAQQDFIRKTGKMPQFSSWDGKQFTK